MSTSPQFEKLLKDNGATLTKAVAYDSLDPTDHQGVVAHPGVAAEGRRGHQRDRARRPDEAFTPDARHQRPRQDYYPEWIITGFGYTDFDVFARAFDQEQMKHAFGIGSLTPFSTPAPGGVTETSLQPFAWYWGDATTRTNDGGFVNPFVYQALHYAGPTLTAANVKKGLFAAPVQTNGTAGGAIGLRQHGRSAVPRVRALRVRVGDDLVEPRRETGPSNAVGIPGTGKFMYLSDG